MTRQQRAWEKALERYRAGEPYPDLDHIASAFAAGWDAHIDYNVDQVELRNAASSGCAPPLFLVGLLVTVMTLFAASSLLLTGLYINVTNVALFTAGGVVLLLLGRVRLRSERANYREAKRDHENKWGKP